MPSDTEKQRRTACVALSIKTGKSPRWVGKAARGMADSMTEEQLREYCGSVKK